MIQIGHITSTDCTGFVRYKKMPRYISVRDFFAGCVEMITCVFLHGSKARIAMICLCVIRASILISIQVRRILVPFFNGNAFIPNTANGVYIATMLILDKKIQSK